jgi:superfamily I DNA and/or RNA helicase
MITKNKNLIQQASSQYKEQLQIQMSSDGSFPEEMSRTRPFHYSLYNLNAWTILASTLRQYEKDIAQYTVKNGMLKNAINFIIPYYRYPKTWMTHTSLEKEIHTTAEPFLYLSSDLYKDKKYLDIWNSAIKEDIPYIMSQKMILQSIRK